MAATPVTPVAGLVSKVTTGGVAVTVDAGAPNGGFIVNPASASDQGLGSAEDLFIDPVNAAGLAGNGTTFRISPGQKWDFIPGQTTPTTVNAVSSNHNFSVVRF